MHACLWHALMHAFLCWLITIPSAEIGLQLTVHWSLPFGANTLTCPKSVNCKYESVWLVPKSWNPVSPAAVPSLAVSRPSWVWNPSPLVCVNAMVRPSPARVLHLPRRRLFKPDKGMSRPLQRLICTFSSFLWYIAPFTGRDSTVQRMMI